MIIYKYFMYETAKQGWYKLLNPDKFIKQLDEYMKSYKDGCVNFKSSLEYKAIRYCDFNKHITKWSLEPFAVKYLKPTDGKVHRYFIDFFIEFSSGDKFIVEVKSDQLRIILSLMLSKIISKFTSIQVEVQSLFS